MNTDFSVAPEIERLAVPFVPAQQDTVVPRTDGRVAGDLARLAAAPERWWDLVRFDPDGPVRIPLPGMAGAWLLVLPPNSLTDCDCAQATLLAGEAAEAASPGGLPRPLRPGRVWLHGSSRGHRLRAADHGYSVSLHSAARGGTTSLHPPV